MPKKVTIAIPTTDYVHICFTTSLVLMIRRTQLAIDMAICRGSNICHNRNTCVQSAIKNKADYLLFIDNDMSFPPTTVDRMVEICENMNLDILGCNYLVKTPPHRDMVVPLKVEEGNKILLTGIDEVKRLPTGMMLIRMSVFDKIEPPWFILMPETIEGQRSVGTEDYVFCDRAREVGFKIFMDRDLSFSLVHWGSPFGIKWEPEPPGYRHMTDMPIYTEA